MPTYSINKRRIPPRAVSNTAQDLARDVANKYQAAGGTGAPPNTQPAGQRQVSPEAAADVAQRQAGGAQTSTQSTAERLRRLKEQKPSAAETQASLDQRFGGAAGKNLGERAGGVSGPSGPAGAVDSRRINDPYGGLADQTYVLQQDNIPPQTGGEQAADSDTEMTDEEAINKAISDLLRQQQDVSKEREAMIGEMKANQARDIQSTRARAGLGGMGLTGAAGAMESQVRQETGREQALQTAAFDRAARQEALDRLIKGVELKRGEQVFGASMDMYESEADKDFDGDGLINGKPVGGNIGDGDPNNNKSEEEKKKEETVKSDLDKKMDNAQKAFAEQGLFGSMDEVAAAAFAGAVQLIYGNKADPNDFFLAPTGLPAPKPGKEEKYRKSMFGF